MLGERAYVKFSYHVIALVYLSDRRGATWLDL
jgi:hypothetical protein